MFQRKIQEIPEMSNYGITSPKQKFLPNSHQFMLPYALKLGGLYPFETLYYPANVIVDDHIIHIQLYSYVQVLI